MLCFVSTLVTTTFAPGTRVPLGSRTLTTSPPVSCCAKRVRLSNAGSRKRTQSSRKVVLLAGDQRRIRDIELPLNALAVKEFPQYRAVSSVCQQIFAPVCFPQDDLGLLMTGPLTAIP